MDEEMNAFIKNKTWDLVLKPDHIKPITCKWVYKVKRKADGKVDRFKARLVARGFSQSYGEDYEETFSSVAKMTSVRVVLSLASSQNWKLWQLDVKNAFLYGDLDKDIYMEQPLGYISKSHPGYVCKLKKAIYGLKQAPRAWFGKIAEFLQICSYHSTDADSSLFVKKNGDVHMVVLVYVDDMIVTGSREDEIARLRGELSTRFDMKNLGELSHFLGLEVKNLDGILLSQEGYANKVIERYKLKFSKKRSTPLDTSEKLRRTEGAPLPDFITYRSLVGGLLYLTITRPDIAYSVGLISRYLQEPRKPHLEAAKKILKYVNSTIDFCLFYKRRGNFHLQGYTDADFGGDLDERKSTSGYVFMCNDTSVSWAARNKTP
ncbi:unnamed protein product [Rhodiola kirilowii]